MDMRAVKKAYSYMFWGTMFFIVSIKINFVIYGVSLRIVGLLFLTSALFLLDKETAIPEFLRALKLGYTGMGIWTFLLIWNNLTINKHFMGATFNSLLNEGLWYLLILMFYSNVLTGSAKLVQGSRNLELWNKWLPVLILVFALLSFASAFIDAPLWIAVILGEIVVTIGLMELISKLEKQFIIPDETIL